MTDLFKPAPASRHADGELPELNTRFAREWLREMGL